MPLTALQKAWLANHSHNVLQVLDDDGNPIVLGGEVWANFVIEAGGLPITAGIKGDIVLVAGTITEVRLLADVAGDIVVDLWKDTYANFAPTVADSITAAAKPTLSSALKYQNTTLTGWTKTIADGDILRFNVDSSSTMTRCTVALKIERS